jgi:hypothetical protein
MTPPQKWKSEGFCSTFLKSGKVRDFAPFFLKVDEKELKK